MKRRLLKSPLWLILFFLLLLGCTAEAVETPAVIPTPTLTLQPPGVKTTSVPDPKEAAQAFLEAWQEEDYVGMYAQLSTLSQEAIAVEDFEARLTDLLRAAEAVHDVAITCHGGITRPPKPVDARAQKLFDLVKDCGTALGQEIGWKYAGN